MVPLNFPDCPEFSHFWVLEGGGVLNRSFARNPTRIFSKNSLVHLLCCVPVILVTTYENIYAWIIEFSVKIYYFRTKSRWYKIINTKSKDYV